MPSYHVTMSSLFYLVHETLSLESHVFKFKIWRVSFPISTFLHDRTVIWDNLRKNKLVHSPETVVPFKWNQESIYPWFLYWVLSLGPCVRGPIKEDQLSSCFVSEKLFIALDLLTQLSPHSQTCKYSSVSQGINDHSIAASSCQRSSLFWLVCGA